MRRYLLVLVTIAVVLSLALVGCVGQPQQPEQPPSEETPTTPPAYTPNPANGSKFLLGSKVTIDWTGWDPGFEPQIFKLYYATGTCTKPGTWTEIKIEKDPCCPIETKKTITVNECGVYWWKVWACGDDASATVGPFWFCSVPGFVVEIIPEGEATPIVTGTVKPGAETLDLVIDACSLPATAVITIDSTAATLCAKTYFEAKITTEATPYFAVSPASATWTSGTPNPLVNATLTTVATVCSSLFGQTIATLTFTVFPDEVEQCATVTHCCKTVYKVNIILEGEEPELLLWAACGPCGVACDCGWLVLKVPACLSPATDDTLTVGDPIKIFGSSTASIPWYEVYSFEWVYGDPDVDDYVYFARCLTDVGTATIDDGVKSYPGAQAIEAGKTYYIDMKKGTFQLENEEGVAFGWPCADWKKKPITATAGQE